MTRWPFWAFLGVAFGAAPAAAQQSLSVQDFLSPPNAALGLPRAADTGKPVIFEPPPLTAEPPARPSGCSVALVCDLRLNGALQKNGVVELNAPALKW